MKKVATLLLTLSLVIGVSAMSSCTTAYDAHGRPVQVVDPAAAAVGALAIGAAAYAIGNNNRDHRGGSHYGNRCRGGCYSGCPHNRGGGNHRGHRH